MQQFYIALACWAGILLLAVPYVRRARHPEAKPLAAYLIFLTVFTAAAAVIFSLLGNILAAFGLGAWLVHPAGAVLFLILVFGPAYLLGRWQVRKPPRRWKGPE